MTEVAIYVDERKARLIEEYFRQHDIYELVVSKVLDTRGGNVTLHIDEKGVIRTVVRTETIIITK